MNRILQNHQRMIYILWTLLNAAFGIACLIIGFRLTRLSYKKHGLFVTLILFCLLTSFFCVPHKEAEKAPWQSLHFAGGHRSVSFSSDNSVWSIPDSTAGRFQLRGDTTVTVFKSPLFKICLSVFYGTDTATGRLAPLYARAYFEGWQSGICWKTIAPAVATNESDDSLEYRVTGEMKRTLANVNIYTEETTYFGTIPIRL